MIFTSFVAALMGQPTPAIPQGPWSAQRGETTCLLSRSFALDDGTALKLHINPDLIGPGVLLLVEGPAAGREPGFHDEPALQLANGERIERIHMFTDRISDNRLMTRITTSFEPDTGPRRETKSLGPKEIARMVRMTQEQRDRERREVVAEERDDVGPLSTMSGEVLTVSYDDDTSHRFESLALAQVRNFSRECTEAVVAEMAPALDPIAIPQKPAAPFDSGFALEDYPKEIVKGLSVRIETLVHIEADGSVSDCRLLVPSGLEAFDRDYCSVVRRSTEFIPAQDANGQDVESLKHWRDTISIKRQTFTTASPL